MDSFNYLKENTRVLHEKLDHHPRVLRLLASDCRIEEYVYFLTRWYGFLFSVERSIYPGLTQWKELSLEERIRSKHIEEDLIHVGFTERLLRNIPVPPPYLPGTTTAYRLGALYVMEGSTLGGPFLMRRVHDLFSFIPTAGATFLNSYGPERAAMWNSLKTFLGNYMQNHPEEKPFILEGAAATFRNFHWWLEPKGLYPVRTIQSFDSASPLPY